MTLIQSLSRLLGSEDNPHHAELSEVYGGFSEAFDNLFSKQAYERRQQVQAVEDAKVRTAAEFLQDHFQKLGDEQAKGLADAEIGDYTADNVLAFEEKLRLANRLVLTQADTRFGTQIVDRALGRLGHHPYTFRRTNCVK